MINVFKLVDGKRIAYIQADCDKKYIENVINSMYHNADIDWLVEKLITSNIKEVNFTDNHDNAIEIILR